MISLSRKDFKNIALLLALCGGLYFFNLGGYGFFDPDEPFYAMTAKEMLLRHDWSTPFLFGAPQFEKPPLAYWVIASFFKLFGINELAARLGPALAGTLTVLVTYFWGLALFKKKESALISALILATAGEFIVLSRIVLTDMFLTLFMAATLYCFTLGYKDEHRRKSAWLLMFLFASLAMLTKGPLGVILPLGGIILYLILNKETRFIKEIPWKWGGLIFLIVGFGWYLLMAKEYGLDFLRHFFIHENVRRFFTTEHEDLDRIFYYPATLLIGFFPWSLFIPGAFLYAWRRISSGKPGKEPLLFLFCLILVIYVFFSMAKSKLPSYIFVVFPILALIMGDWLYRFHRAVRLGFRPKISMTLLVMLYTALLPVLIVSAAAFFDRKNHIGLSSDWLMLAAFFVTPMWLALLFFTKKELKKSLVAVIAAVALLAFYLFAVIFPKIEPYFSSKSVSRQFEKISLENKASLLLCSKLYVRGIYYYTQASPGQMGVLTSNPDIVFYTKHPIMLLSRKEELLALAKEKFPAFCFFRPKEFKLLKERIDGDFSVTIMHSAAQKIVARLERDF